MIVLNKDEVNTMTSLAAKTCIPCKGGVDPLQGAELDKLLTQVPEWGLNPDGLSIQRDFKFKNYYKTMAFVNALAYISHQTDHHADLEVGYNHCRVVFSTHAIGGLSESDFICAAKIDLL
jgi:4a-hydroxytetrahydrobiopterin dehydratase